VDSNWVVTAAHCFYTPQGERVIYEDDMSVVIGEHVIRDESGFTSDNDEFDTIRKNLKIDKIIIHENYNTRTFENDIALLKLKDSLDLSTYTPACLPSKGQTWVGEKGWVYGWGTEFSGSQSLSPILKETSQSIISNQACAAPAQMSGSISDDMLCGLESGTDSCQGDSGGPFTVDVSGKHFLAGVVSWGLGCAAPGLAGVYSDVSYQRDWIDSTVALNGGANFCAP